MSRITDDSKALQKFLKQVSRGFEIKTGILQKGDDKHESKAQAKRQLTIAYLASIHEFGLGVPERSFIRGWFDAQEDAILEIIFDRVTWALKNKKPLHLAAEQAAVKLAASCQARIVSGWTYDDIAAATKKRKGSSTPLIDTGVLKSAIVGEAKML